MICFKKRGVDFKTLQSRGSWSRRTTSAWKRSTSSGQNFTLQCTAFPLTLQKKTVCWLFFFFINQDQRRMAAFRGENGCTFIKGHMRAPLLRNVLQIRSGQVKFSPSQATDWSEKAPENVSLWWHCEMKKFCFCAMLFLIWFLYSDPVFNTLCE